MKRLPHPSLRQKLLLILILPMLLVSYFIATMLWQNGQTIRVMGCLERHAQVVLGASDLMHELQKERGRSFASLKGLGQGESLQDQRLLTDARLTQFQGISARRCPAGLGIDFAQQLDRVQVLLSALAALRQQVDAALIAEQAVFERYTELIDQLLKLALLQSIHMKSESIPHHSAAYLSYLRAKEYAGRERAVLSRVLKMDRFSAESKREFILLQAEQRIYLDLFEEYVGMTEPGQSGLAEEREALDEVQRIQALAWTREYGFGIDPEHWFAVSTRRIEQLKQVADQLGSGLRHKAVALHDQARARQYFWLIVCAITFGITLLLSLAIIRVIERTIVAEQQKQMDLVKRLEGVDKQLLQSEKMAAIGQLAAGVAHEINNPVGYVSSNLYTLEHYLDDLTRLVEGYERLIVEGSETQRQRMQQLRQHLDVEILWQDLRSLVEQSKQGMVRVKGIVQSLNDFSREGGGAFSLSDLHQGFETTISVAWHELKYKAEIVREFGDIPLCYCDLPRLNQVFLNLLVNAAQAIEDRGRIYIRTGADINQIWFEVEDTGCGMSEEVVSHIFDPFFTTKEPGKGTGLGLSVSYGIVQQHQGRIEVNSRLGHGTRFRVVLPRLQKPEPADNAALADLSVSKAGQQT